MKAGTVKAGTRDAAQDPSCGCTVCVLTHVCHRWWTARGVNNKRETSGRGA